MLAFCHVLTFLLKDLKPNHVIIKELVMGYILHFSILYLKPPPDIFGGVCFVVVVAAACRGLIIYIRLP